MNPGRVLEPVQDAGSTGIRLAADQRGPPAEGMQARRWPSTPRRRRRRAAAAAELRTNFFTQPTSQERYPPANPGRLVGRLAPSQSLLSNSDWVLVDPPAGRGLRVDSALG